MYDVLRSGVEPLTFPLKEGSSELLLVTTDELTEEKTSLPRGTRTLDPQINNTTLAFTQANYLSCCSLDYSITMHFCLGVPYVVSTPFISIR